MGTLLLSVCKYVCIPSLRPAICIFYLILRALDTVEDDMTIPREEKEGMLLKFHANLYEPDWRYLESKEKDRAVLEEFPTVSQCFLYANYAWLKVPSNGRVRSIQLEYIHQTVKS